MLVAVQKDLVQRIQQNTPRLQQQQYLNCSAVMTSRNSPEGRKINPTPREDIIAEIICNMLFVEVAHLNCFKHDGETNTEMPKY